MRTTILFWQDHILIISINSFFMNICPALISLSFSFLPSMLMSGTVSSSGSEAGRDGRQYTASHLADSSGDGRE